MRSHQLPIEARNARREVIRAYLILLGFGTSCLTSSGVSSRHFPISRSPITKRADCRSNQLTHAATDGLDHPADLAVSTLRDRDFEERRTGAVAHARHFGRCSGTITQFDALSKPIQIVIAEVRVVFTRYVFGNFAFGLMT